MNIFFSPSVSSYQILSPHFQACDIVQKLLETNSVEFDLNLFDDSTDPFFLIHSRVKMLKHKVSKMIEQIENKYNQRVKEMPNQDRILIISKMKQYIRKNRIDHLKYLDEEEHILEQKMGNFYQFANNYDTFLNVRTRLEEQLDTLRAKIQITQKGHVMEEFVIVSGVCSNKIIGYLEKIIFRQSKGHSITVFKAREKDLKTSVFLCLINKNIYKHIGPKITKTSELNNVNLYDLPNILKNMHQHEHSLIKRLREAEDVIQMSGKQLTAVLHEHIVGKQISLKQHLLKVSYLERLIYIICHSKQIGDPPNHVLFTFHIPSNSLLPQLPAAIFTLKPDKKKYRTIMPRLECLNQVNILTQLFSIPKHNQIIPSIFMFTTVPFLFGMMFSDFGHGILLLLVSFMLKLSPVFYMMSFMSIYCGIIYNQFFGMKIIRWSNLGIVQPVWAVSQNGLNFQNSLKMKVSMIMAFVHMAFGMILKIVNERKRGQYNKIFYDSLPKIGLLMTTVGYLVFLIIKKWCTNFEGTQSTAPSIINSILQLYLGWNPQRKHSILGSIQTQYMVGAFLNKLNLILLLILVYNQTLRSKVSNYLISIFQKSPKFKRNKSGYKQLNDENQQGLDYQISEQLQTQSKEVYQSLQHIQQTYYHQQEQEHNQLGPLQVFQFVLSLISSTTSYLRLFALSLAHAKLSSLILNMLLSTLSGPHPYVSLIRCVAFFCITLGMMLTLDVMECLMHVVRLHWVQWMGKFYTGSGKLLIPQIQHSYA